MQNLYKLSILYFLLFSLLLIISSIALFEVKIGFSTHAVVAYYLGDAQNFNTKKSFVGILKIALPHIFAFSLFLMVVLHFLLFGKYKKSAHFKWLILLSFLSAFFEIFIPFGIIYTLEALAFVKIVSLILFELTLLYSLWLLFESIVYE